MVETAWQGGWEGECGDETGYGDLVCAEFRELGRACVGGCLDR